MRYVFTLRILELLFATIFFAWSAWIVWQLYNGPCVPLCVAECATSRVSRLQAILERYLRLHGN